MFEGKSNRLGNTVVLLDLLLTVLAYIASFIVISRFSGQEGLDIMSHLFLLPLVIFLVTTLLTYFGGYESPRKNSVNRYSWAIVRVMVLTVALLLSLLFILKIQYVNRKVVMAFAVAETCLLLVLRIAVVQYYKAKIVSGENKLKVLIVGTRERALELLRALKTMTVWGVEVVGFVDPDPELVGQSVRGIPVIGTVENIHTCLKDNVIDEVVIAISRSLLSDAEQIAIACEEEGIKLRFMADVFNVQMARMSLEDVRGIPLLTLEPVAQDPQQLFAKRLLDLTLTTLALPFLIPLFALVVVAIKIDSPGPAFFVQQRVGLRKHIFPMIKFRSMYIDAEERLKDVEHLNEADGPIFKIKNDPRVTRVGRFIRKTSIDELPQLINVLRGEMSLVGPRPMSQRDVGLFDHGLQRKRFSVQPGLTCIWQISGRSDLPFAKWLELDLQYIEEWNFWLDVKILCKTIPAVLFSKGAS